MIEFKNLTFNNIRCFIEPQTIDFSNRDKLIQVDGKNENTGGSSGAGKTTVFLALDYLLGISDVPATVLQSRLTKDSIEVSGNFLLNGKSLKIDRSKKTGLTINLDGDIVSGNSKLAEEKLDEIIGIPRKIFKKMIHKHQKEGGFFLDMTAKETYEFLVEMLNLGNYISKEQEIVLGVKTHKQKIESLQNECNSLSESIKSLEMVLGQKNKPETSLEKTKELLDAFQKRANEVRSSIDIMVKNKDSEIGAISPPSKTENEPVPNDDKLQALVSSDDALHWKYEKILQALEAVKGQILNVSVLAENSNKLGIDISSLKGQKDHIESSLCPTCRQTWRGNDAKHEVERISSEIDRLTTVALNNKTLIDELPTHESNKIRLEDIIQKMIPELHESKNNVTTCREEILLHKQKQENEYLKAQEVYRNQISEIEKKYQDSLDRFNQELRESDSEFISLQTKYQATENALKAYQQEVDSLNQMIAQKNQEKVFKESEAITIKQIIMVSEESARLIKTYVLHTFQETLDLIGEMTTDILSSIPNMQTSTVFFEGCKETKNGSLKDEVTAVISMDGNNAIPIKSLSGGERTAIDLAVDLAVIDVIETKSNKGADFYVIDEPFDGLDSVCKENCLEILKQVDTNKKIIMVDHSSELKEMISDIITVIKSGESSKVIERNVVL